MDIGGGAIAALVAASSISVSEASERYGKQKVVYHINYDGGPDSKKYKGAMRNIQNHIKAVLHGNSIGVLMTVKENDELQTAVSSLKGPNVSFHVCNNTLKGRKISYSDDLYDTWEEDIVPSGVAELSHLQQMGYTYITA